jgi:MoxR-like ATPase
VIAGVRYERVKSAAARLCAFFRELEGAFVEREDVLRQLALALLAREHVLLTGPPGTAKSRMAWAALGRIVDEGSGEPSLFARQFTESTVQTDLVGPIDFKTLMETGRTEHFTDEGMLGATHAFLDEVFDGRDMLLRTTLNVLHERELKQGTKTTRGQIECAVMTTNRYLSEVLESSREALLAFVDRVAHVAFVPKGFGQAESLGRLLRTQLGGTGARPLSAVLTLQDLDALQAATTDVVIPPDACDLLSEFVLDFEREIAVAVRADPSFVPTRYLSTRTVLRLGTALRAACVYDWAHHGQQRPLRVERTDFESLRFSLVLCGPRPEHVKHLLEVEPDPRERRQLETLRTEREIFDRCLGRLRELRFVAAAPAVEAPVLAAGDEQTLRDVDSKALLQVARQLATSTKGFGDRSPAELRLNATLTELGRRAFRDGLEPDLGAGLSPSVAAENMASWADELEAFDGERRAVARFLRARALEMLRHALELAPARSGESLEQWLGEGWSVERASAVSHGKIADLQKLLALATRLLGHGAQARQPAAWHQTWQRALQACEEDLVTIWDLTVRSVAAPALSSVAAGELAAVLEGLSEPLQAARQVGSAFAGLGGNDSALESRVFGVRLLPLVRAACQRFDGQKRAALAARVEELLGVLERFGLGGALPRAELLGWLLGALLRAEPDWRAIGGRHSADHAGYRALRAENERRSLAFAVAELGELLHRSEQGQGDDPLDGVRALCAELPAELRTQLASADLLRIESALQLLDAWWRGLSLEKQAPRAALETLSVSRFLHVTRDESALVRFALELDLLQKLLPEADVGAVRARLAELEQRTSTTLRTLMAMSLNDDFQALGGAPR